MYKSVGFENEKSCVNLPCVSMVDEVSLLYISFVCGGLELKILIVFGKYAANVYGYCGKRNGAISLASVRGS